MSANQEKKTTRALDAVIFDLIILCFFLLLAIISLKYNPRARSIPLALGVIGSVMAFLQCLVDTFPRVRSKLRFVSSSGLLAKENPLERQEAGKAKDLERSGPEAQTSPSQDRVETRGADWWRVFRIILWLVGFIVLLALTNYLIAVGAFVVLVTRLEAGESWKRSILLALCVDLGFYILFDLLLQAQL